MTVNYQTLTSGTATAGDDFVAAAGTVTFAAGQRTASVSVNILGDVAVEGAETVQVQFTGSRLAASIIGTGTITNDDVANVPVSAVTDSNGAEGGSVAENAVVGTVVGITASATDANAGDTVTYALTTNPGNLFAIDAATGVVTVAGALNRAVATSHSITVTATSSDGSTSNADFNINVAEVTTPQTFVLTAAQEAKTGGTGNDTFTAGPGTVNGDVLVGGDGTDTLKITTMGDRLTQNVPVPELLAFSATGIEQIVIRAPVSATGALIDAGDISGVDEITFLNSVGNVSLVDLAEVADVAVIGGNGADTNTRAELSLDYRQSIVSSGEDAVDLTLEDNANTAVSIGAGIERLDVTIVGDNDVDLTVDGADIDITGDGSLVSEIAYADQISNSASGTVDIAIVGSVSRVTHAGTGDMSVDAHGFNEVVINNIGEGDLVVEDVGNEATILNAGSGGLTVTNAGIQATITSIGSGDATVTNAGDDATITNSGTGKLTVTNVGDNVTITNSGSGDLTVSEAGDKATIGNIGTGAASVTLTGLDASIVNSGEGAMTIGGTGGVSQVQGAAVVITNSGKGAMTIEASEATDITSSGSGALTVDEDAFADKAAITASGSGDLDVSVKDRSVTIDASASTGLVAVAVAAASQAAVAEVTFTGSGGDDTVTFEDGALDGDDTLNGGNGDDLLQVGTGTINNKFDWTDVTHFETIEYIGKTAVEWDLTKSTFETVSVGAIEGNSGFDAKDGADADANNSAASGINGGNGASAAIFAQWASGTTFEFTSALSATGGAGGAGGNGFSAAVNPNGAVGGDGGSGFQVLDFFASANGDPLTILAEGALDTTGGAGGVGGAGAAGDAKGAGGSGGAGGDGGNAGKTISVSDAKDVTITFSQNVTAVGGAGGAGASGGAGAAGADGAVGSNGADGGDGGMGGAGGMGGDGDSVLDLDAATTVTLTLNGVTLNSSGGVGGAGGNGGNGGDGGDGGTKGDGGNGGNGGAAGAGGDGGDAGITIDASKATTLNIVSNVSSDETPITVNRLVADGGVFGVDGEAGTGGAFGVGNGAGKANGTDGLAGAAGGQGAVVGASNFTLAVAKNATITVTGEADLNLGFVSAEEVTFDASGLEGDLTVAITSSNQFGTNPGGADDVITGGKGANTITLLDGGIDTIDLTASLAVVDTIHVRSAFGTDATVVTNKIATPEVVEITSLTLGDELTGDALIVGTKALTLVADIAVTKGSVITSNPVAAIDEVTTVSFSALGAGETIEIDGNKMTGAASVNESVQLDNGLPVTINAQNSLVISILGTTYTSAGGAAGSPTSLIASNIGADGNLTPAALTGGWTQGGALPTYGFDGFKLVALTAGDLTDLTDQDIEFTVDVNAPVSFPGLVAAVTNIDGTAGGNTGAEVATFFLNPLNASFQDYTVGKGQIDNQVVFTSTTLGENVTDLVVLATGNQPLVQTVQGAAATGDRDALFSVTDGIALVTVPGGATFQQILDTVFADILAYGGNTDAGDAVAFEFGGDTYVAVDGDGDDTYFAGTDFVVKLVGVDASGLTLNAGSLYIDGVFPPT